MNRCALLASFALIATLEKIDRLVWGRLQPDTNISRNDGSGGTETIPTFYRHPSFEFMDSMASNVLAIGMRE
jgi:hypothetical protein